MQNLHFQHVFYLLNDCGDHNYYGTVLIFELDHGKKAIC